MDQSQLVPTEVIVRMPSKAAADSKAQPVFFVHPIEGVVTALKPLASLLDRPVWGLQCVADAPLSSVSDLATFYIKVSTE